jgi:hypothetical protein
MALSASVKLAAAEIFNSTALTGAVVVTGAGDVAGEVVAGGGVVVFGSSVTVGVGAAVVVGVGVLVQPVTTDKSISNKSRPGIIRQVLLGSFISLLYLPGSNAVFNIAVDPDISGFRLFPISR